MCKLYYEACGHCYRLIGTDSGDRQDLCGDMPDCTYRRFIITERGICENCALIHLQQKDIDTDDDENFPTCIEQNLQMVSSETYYNR